jgi:hypothetical protein
MSDLADWFLRYCDIVRQSYCVNVWQERYLLNAFRWRPKNGWPVTPVRGPWLWLNFCIESSAGQKATRFPMNPKRD